MTPFETIMIILAVLIVLLMGFIAYRVNYFLKDLQADKYRDHQLLKNIDVNTATPIDILMRIDKQLCNIESTIDQDLQELIRKVDGISTRMYLHQDNLMKDELMKQINEKIQSFEPPSFPWAQCYLPNGNCPNPQRDCINCPKRGTGGVWTTSTNTIKEE